MPLQHYGIYLDPDLPDDQPLIAYLEPYRRARRVGETLRRALLSYLNSGTPTPAPPRVTPSPLQMQGYITAPSASTSTAADKVKKAFFK